MLNNDEKAGSPSLPPMQPSHPSKLSPAFNTKEATQQYLSSIAPHRDLVCPITQELFKSPVVASDGQTYERQAIRTWFQSQQNSTGSVRSPITNAYIDVSKNGMILVENKAVAGMARFHQERLGEELCLRCQAVWDNGLEAIGDNGFRIKGLVEAGADLSAKGCQGGNTAFMALLQSTLFTAEKQSEEIKFELLNYFLAHNVPVSLINDEGKDCVTIADEILSNIGNSSPIPAYQKLLKQLKQRTKNEEKQRKAQSEARNELNNEHRERQRVLAENARNRTSTDDNDTSLGRMNGGAWGYFPALPILLFQGNVPDPPASYANEEMVEKERLQFIVRCTALIVFIFWWMV